MHVSDDDWAISLSVEQAGTIYDSLGNSVNENPLGTFLFLKVDKTCFLQRLSYDYSGDTMEPKLIIGNRLKTTDVSNLNYTIDSIQLAETEWIYPYIYKNDSLNTYGIQIPADHEPYYGMYFKVTRKEGFTIYFTETDLAEAETFHHFKNLNYGYNSRTFINRVFLAVTALIKGNFKSLDK